MEKNNKKKRLYLGIGLSVCCLLGGVSLVNGFAENSEITSVEICVDTLSYEADDLPNAVEGKSYPVFEMTATNNLGQTVDNVDVLVYAPDGKLLPIVDGRFETATLGNYSIVYTATSGAYSVQETLNVEAVSKESYNEPYFRMEESISDTVYTGGQVFLPDGEYGDGVGELNLTVSVDYFGVYELTQPSVCNFYKGNYFIPEAAGEYVVTYTLTDLVGSKVETRISVSAEDDPTPIMRDPVASKLAQVGETVSFPVTEATLYYNGALIYVPVKVYVNEANVTQTMSYEPEAIGEYTVKYVAENVFDEQYAAIYEYTLCVVEPSIDSYVDNYLYLNDLTTSYRETETDGLEGMVYLLTADGSKESAEMQFKTPLHEQYLSVELGVETEYSEFEDLYVTFTDSENSWEQVKIKLTENQEKKIEMYANGEYVTTLDRSFTEKGSSYEGSKFQFLFNPETNSIEDGQMNVLTTVEYTADGKTFEGFSSGKAYLSICVDGVEGESRIKLYRIASQVISNVVTDRGVPLYITREDFASSFRADINDTVRVSKLEAFDLFEGAAVVSTKITSPTGEIVFNGTLTEDYFFTATEYGVYSIEYTAYDSARNAKKKNAVIEVVDRIPPTLIAPNLPCAIAAGTEYTFASAVVSDNLGGECRTWIYVTNEKDEKWTLTENKYTFTEKGVYTVKYGAADETGNITVVEYTVICE